MSESDERPPLPAGMSVHAITAKQARRTISRAGTPRWRTTDMDLQTLHLLLSDAMERGGAGSAENIVIVDEKGAEALATVMMTAVVRLRPDRREGGFNAVVSRSTAVRTLATSSTSLDLADLEAALVVRTGVVTLVLEEDDFQETMEAMSLTLASMPHGRSAAFG
jgi:hypothetical protein